MFKWRPTPPVPTQKVPAAENPFSFAGVVLPPASPLSPPRDLARDSLPNTSLTALEIAESGDSHTGARFVTREVLGMFGSPFDPAAGDVEPEAFEPGHP